MFNKVFKKKSPSSSNIKYEKDKTDKGNIKSNNNKDKFIDSVTIKDNETTPETSQIELEPLKNIQINKNTTNQHKVKKNELNKDPITKKDNIQKLFEVNEDDSLFTNNDEPKLAPHKNEEDNIVIVIPKKVIKIVSMILIAIILIVIIHYISNTTGNVTKEPTEDIENNSTFTKSFIKPIKDAFPYMKCIVTKKGEKTMNTYLKYLEKEFDFNQTRHSMIEYVKNNGYDGICAFDVGIPLCYCILKYEKNNMLEMFNLNITNFSKEYVMHEEMSHFCEEKGKILKNRKKHVWTEYNLIDGTKMDKYWSNYNSYYIQHMVDLNNGITICDKPENNKELARTPVILNIKSN